MQDIFNSPVFILPKATAEGVVQKDTALPGCCVISPLKRRCGKPGKLLYVLCVHEHFPYPNNEPVEICDGCAKLIETITCTKCKFSKQPHDCKLLVYPAKIER